MRFDSDIRYAHSFCTYPELKWGNGIRWKKGGSSLATNAVVFGCVHLILAVFMPRYGLDKAEESISGLTTCFFIQNKSMHLSIYPI